MSLFDFPRLHLVGDLDINVPTINNAYYFPLTIYDVTRAEPFLPPRLYFSSESIIQGVSSGINPTPVFDPLNNFWYIEILTVNTIDLLRQWCSTPLGQSPLDSDYIPYYQEAEKDIGQEQGTDLMGNAPGYWNMWGDMSVRMSGVRASGVQTCANGAVTTWTPGESGAPASVQTLLNTGFDTDTTARSGLSTAMMVETISSQSVFANVFCSNVNLFDLTTGAALFSGNPIRFAALIYSTWRVYNWMPPMAGSGRFCSAIALDDIQGGDSNPLVSFFLNNRGPDTRPLKGVFVTFTIQEVYENRYDQTIYNNGPIENPAQATTVVSLSPWYEGDMKNGLLGRNLVSAGLDPVYTNTNSVPGQIPINMTPPIAALKTLADGTTVFSVDMGNSWPETMTPEYSYKGFKPAKRGDATFETLEIGALDFRLSNQGGTTFATLQIDPASNSLKKVIACGSLFDFVITDSALADQIRNSDIAGFLRTASGESHVLQESWLMISTEQKGLYTNQGDSPSQGYLVDGPVREPCRIRMARRGEPWNVPTKIFIAEYQVPEAGNDPYGGPTSVNTVKLMDGAEVYLLPEDAQLSNNAIYYFVYEGQYPGNQIPAFNVNNNYTVMDTGSFLCMRVLPVQDYSQYLDESHPNYTPPSFDVVYREIFKLYDVAYPSMARIHPFTEKDWNNGIMAGSAVYRSHLSQWSNVLYMPRSRELSSSQRALIQAWSAFVDEQNGQLPLDPSTVPYLTQSNFEVQLDVLTDSSVLPYVQSMAWARVGSKLILIGGRFEGFHGLNEAGPIFSSRKASDAVWVIDFANLSYESLPLDASDAGQLQFSSSNMQCCQDGNVLYLCGGFGRAAPGDEASDHTFDRIVSISLDALLHQVSIGGSINQAILDQATSPTVQVTGGEMVLNNGIFYLVGGQKYSYEYEVGITGVYTNQVRAFRFQSGQIVNVDSYTSEPLLHRRDLTVAPMVQAGQLTHVAYGGVFTPADNGFVNPVMIDTSSGTIAVSEDPTVQITNQYSCARISMYTQSTDEFVNVLLGGIGRFMYDNDSAEWQDGDRGAKLPFVKSVTQMIRASGQTTQVIQLPPDAQELPALIGANAIFLPDEQLLYKGDIIDYDKIPAGRTRIGLFYGGILSDRATSSSIYPSTFNSTIYAVYVVKDGGANLVDVQTKKQ